ncbi:MAG: FAD-dependent oxidoreductase [Calditrichaeota bacterium]|nr:FAD-dependent oxidoreductase [Calditrichota bacterium]
MMNGSKQTLVIIGGNAAGMSAARKARRNNPELKIIVLEKSDIVSYGACGLPYFISDVIKDANDLLAVPLEKFLNQGIDVRLRHEVVGIEPRKRVVFYRTPEDESPQKLIYDRLILSSGARAVIPKIEGITLPGVFTIRSLSSAVRLKRELQQGKHQKAVIMGAGYIGLEMAEALVKQGVEVTIAEQKSQVLPYIDSDMAALIEDELKKHGCDVRTNREVTRILGDDIVRGVELDDGEKISCSLVIVAVGVRPETELAKKAGIRLGASGAIQVDSHMRTNVINIFAAGDCAEVKNLVTNKYEYIPLGSTANKQGRVAGDNASGKRSQMSGVVATSAVQVFDLEIGRAGITAEYAERLKLPVKSVSVKTATRAGYMPGKKRITVKLIFEVNGGRLKGAQLVGGEGVAKRLDILATALQQKMNVKELAQLDLSYAPPFAPAWDPILIAANQALKLIR